VIGIDAASSAQSKRAGIEVERGATELAGGEAGDGGRETVAVGVGDPLSAVKDVRRGETARLWLNWGELGRIGSERGCSDESGSVRRRSRGVARSPEWGRAGGSAVIDGSVDADVAVAFGGSSCITGVWESSWGWQGGVGGLLDRRCGEWGRQGSFVECTTRSDERVRTASYSSVSWAVHSLRTSFPACLSIPGVSVVVWVLDVAVVVVSEVVMAGVAAVVGGDVAFALGCSRREVGGQ
jgi:hypothetical protein